MSQLSSNLVVEPFGEVNVFTDANNVRIKATILMRPSVEGAQTGLAIDGSASMKMAFGAAGAVSTLFAASSPNIVEPVARTIGSFLANFDSDGRTSVIYWACGIGGGELEDLGDMTAAEVKARSFAPPKNFGSGTKLLPAIQHFAETKFPAAPWSIFVFITDGAIEDLGAVKQYSIKLGRQVADGTRNFIKLVLIGVGAEVNEGQMEELDDLDYGDLMEKTGEPIDLWDHKMASSMQKIEEIFAEVVTGNTILAPSATINDAAGNPVKPIGRGSYADGLPALLEFAMPTSSKSFTLNLPNGKSVTQPIG